MIKIKNLILTNYLKSNNQGIKFLGLIPTCLILLIQPRTVDLSIAEMLKYLDQMISYHFGISPFDVVSFDEVNQFSVLEKSHGRR